MMTAHEHGIRWRVASAAHATALAFVVAAASGVVACGDDGDKPVEQSRVLADTTQQVILPNLEQLRTDATALQAAGEAFCAEPTEASLTTAQQAWLKTKASLEMGKAWRIGPYVDHSIAQQVDKWPANPENIEAVIASDDTLDEAYIRLLAYTKRLKGLPALEYLLFFGGDDGAVLPLYNASTPQAARRCSFLVALTQDVHARLTGLHNAWVSSGDDYAAELMRAGQQGINRFVSQLIGVVDTITMMKLGEALGNSNGGTPVPQAVESGFSESSLENISNALKSMALLYKGNGGVSLSAYTRFRKKAVDDEITKRLEDARAAVESLQGLDKPLKELVVQEREKVQAVYSAVDWLGKGIESELVTILGVTVTSVESDND